MSGVDDTASGTELSMGGLSTDNGTGVESDNAVFKITQPKKEDLMVSAPLWLLPCRCTPDAAAPIATLDCVSWIQCQPAASQAVYDGVSTVHPSP